MTPNSLVAPTAGVWSFTTTPSAIYVFNGSGIGVYSLSGAFQRQLPMPANLQGTRLDGLSGPIVDSAGNVYVASSYGNFIDSVGPDGTLRWTKSISAPRIFPLRSESGGFELGVTQVHVSTSTVLDGTGAAIATIPLVKQGPVSVTPSGTLLMTTGSYIQTWTGDGTRELGQFGSAPGTTNHDGGAFAIAPGLGGQSAQVEDGTIYTTDPNSLIVATSPTGLLKGEVQLKGSNVLTGLTIEGDEVFFQSGSPVNSLQDTVDEISLQALNTYIDGPHGPLNTLGWGADVRIDAAGNYFPSGVAPTAAASFDSWWSGPATHLSLTYAVRSASDIRSGQTPLGGSLPLPTDPTSLARIDLPIASEAATPGPYQLAVSLQDTTTVPPTTIAEACVPFTVGAAGNKLDLSQLPEGPGAGGPPDQRGVLLNGQLGLNGFRGVLSLSAFLPDCSAAAPTAADCSSSAITFTSAPAEPFKAAYEATTSGVTYWLQMSGGDAVSKAVVTNGWWQADIEAIVAHYSAVPTGCGNCSPIVNWEPWNEPNNTGWSNGATYVTQVLEPFYQAVKMANPSATVIGGNSLGVAAGWWKQLISAGGLQYMDVAGVHPYPGSNDSWEEDGIPTALRALQSLVSPKPVWITEVAWWSDGDYNYLHQSDAVASAMLWQAGLNIPVWEYFFDEGSWGDSGLSYSLIETDGADDYVKPAALAVMTAHSEIAGRSVLQAPTLGDPAVYTERFGPRRGTSDGLLAVWSDELNVADLVTVTSPDGSAVPVTVTDEYGWSRTVSVPSGQARSLPVSAAVSYLGYPANDTLTVRPVEAYGSDLGTALAGAKATPSSGNAASALGDPASASYSGQGWTSASGDTQPSLTITLADPTTVNRIVVDTASMGSTAPGVRDYTVAVEDAQGAWASVDTVQNQFSAHQNEIWISPQQVAAVRVTVSEVNYGGYLGGAIPGFWSPAAWAGAFLHSVQVYAGTLPAGASSSYPPLLSAAPGSANSSPGGGLSGGGSSSSSTSPPAGSPASSSPPAGSPASSSPPAGSPQPAGPPPPSAGSSSPSSPPPPGSSTPSGVGSSGGDSSTPPPLPVNPPTSAVSHPLPVHVDGLVAAASNGGATWLVTPRGNVYTSGRAAWLGDPSSLKLAHPIVAAAPTPDGHGYWLVASDGGVFSYGDARFHGSLGGLTLNAPIIGIAATPSGRGYWLVASDGGVFAFGDAQFFGSTGNIPLNAPIVTIVLSRDGRGYRLVASDGGVFCFGDATFRGSTGGIHLAQPIVGALGTGAGAGDGYWLVARDGGIFAFGRAAFYGSAASKHKGAPVIGLAPGEHGLGYVAFTASGEAYAFGPTA